MLNTADSNERQGWFNLHERYKTDFFEFYFFRKASGFMFLDGDKIELHDNCVLIIPPFKRQEWHVQMEELDYTFLYSKKSLSITLSPQIFYVQVASVVLPNTIFAFLMLNTMSPAHNKIFGAKFLSFERLHLCC